MAAFDETADTSATPIPPVGPARVRVALDRPHPAGGVPMAVLLAVGCGGVVGALCRYLVQLALPTDTGRFPMGTFVINVSGSALLGFLLVTINERFAERRLLRPLLGTGLIGAYTTFSTFGVEAVLLVRAGHASMAGVYVALSVICGLGAGLLGMTTARLSLRQAIWRNTET